MLYPTKKGEKVIFRKGLGIRPEGIFHIKNFHVTHWQNLTQYYFNNLADLLEHFKYHKGYNNLIKSLDIVYKNKDLNENSYPRISVELEEQTAIIAYLSYVNSLRKIRKEKINRINE